MSTQQSFSIPEHTADPSHLFPCPIRCGFTTAPKSASFPKEVTHTPLADKALGVTKNSSGTTHDVVDKAWKAVYPEGSINPGNKEAPRGGFGFYLAGPPAVRDFSFEGSNEVLFSYSVLFEPGFNFNKGGKLPGLYGGTTAEIAYGCSGGRKEGRDKCFSLRLMWRKNGDGEIYGYLPHNEQNKETLLKVPPKSKLNPDYGFSIGTGSWRFVPGEWATIAQRIKFNDVGCANGEMDLWVNGEKVICVEGVIIREDEACVARGAHFQTFFGGHTTDWASPKSQCTLFADISGAIL